VIAVVRNVNRQQAAVAGVIAAEVLGFFTLGEIIGRFKVIGYRGDTGHHH
jgi:F-type H+-transporting ATPase subunit g